MNTKLSFYLFVLVHKEYVGSKFESFTDFVWLLFKKLGGL